MTGVGEGTILAERYRLEQKLGEGAMGSVWKAEHLMLGSKVAIKLLDESIAAHGVALARFMREARAAASLKSVHVVQIHDYGVDQKMPYIAMEFLEGETLADRLRRVARLPPPEAALVLTHVARGISRAHEAGVVHRDLKPDNIFLLEEDDEQYAKVLDFGVAKAGEGVFAATLTSAGKLLGTPAYMSAEQAAGLAVDHRTDIWSLAVIAFECLTGELPFVGDDLPDLLHAIHDGPIPIPSHLGPVPEGFDAWFAKGVARNVDDRYYSAKTMVAELRALCGVKTVTRGSATELADEERQRETPTPNESDVPDASDTTSARIARAFQAREEEEPPESMYDDIIRTHDVLADSVARPVDDILTDEDFDEAVETPPTVPSPDPPETAAADASDDPSPHPASANPQPPSKRSSERPTGRLVSQPPPKPKDRVRPRESESNPVSASRAAPDDVRVEFDHPPSPTPDPPTSTEDGQAPRSETITSTGTVVTVAPRRRGQIGLLVAAAFVVVLGTAAGTIAFVLRGPRSDASAAQTLPSESPADPNESTSRKGTEEPRGDDVQDGVQTGAAASPTASADPKTDHLTVSPAPSASDATPISVVPVVGPAEHQ